MSVLQFISLIEKDCLRIGDFGTPKVYLDSKHNQTKIMKTKLLFTAFLCFSFYSLAQKHTLTGTIYDEENNILVGANVIVKNSKQGTITNEKGQFTIKVTAKEVLEVSYVGFETKEITIGDQEELSIILKSQWEEIDAVEIIACKGNRISCRLYCKFLFEELPATDKKQPTSLFPNPSYNGLFQLKLNENYREITVQVFDMNGQLIQSNTYTNLSKIPQIDVSAAAKGMYLLKISADGEFLETKKAIRL